MTASRAGAHLTGAAADHRLYERTEYLIRERLSFMRFLGLGFGDTVPDANTIWNFREALTRSKPTTLQLFLPRSIPI